MVMGPAKPSARNDWTAWAPACPAPMMTIFSGIFRANSGYRRGVTMPVDGPQPAPSCGPKAGLKAMDMAQISETFRGEFPLPDLGATTRLGAAIAGGIGCGDAVALW